MCVYGISIVCLFGLSIGGETGQQLTQYSYIYIAVYATIHGAMTADCDYFTRLAGVRWYGYKTSVGEVR